MDSSGARKAFLTAIVWSILFALAAVSYKYLVSPRLRGKLEDETGSKSRYVASIPLALDAFSGYAVLRSPLFSDLLRERGVRVEPRDDGADYGKRIRALKSGETPLAAFTIDSYLAAGARLGEFPGAIVLVLDESDGADALVARRDGVPTIQALNHASARVVVTPDSPSETLARAMVAHFSLPDLPAAWRTEVAGAEAVLERLRAAKAGERTAFALWEPFVSKALSDPAVHVLIDSSKLRGHVVDVLVAERRFLKERPEIVREFVAAYLTAAWRHANGPGGLPALVRDDGPRSGQGEFPSGVAERLAGRILWKNTLENYAHFGLLPSPQARGLPHLEDMIRSIADVLARTGALDRAAIDGREASLFHDRVLASLRDDRFHPSASADAGDGHAGDLGEIRPAASAERLDDAGWGALLPVADLAVPPIAFARGGSAIHLQGQRDLDRLADHLEAWPAFYLVVTGHARAEGDPAENLKLAEERARAAQAHLLGKGIGAERIRAVAAPPEATGAAGQSVSFRLFQRPY